MDYHGLASQLTELLSGSSPAEIVTAIEGQVGGEAVTGLTKLSASTLTSACRAFGSMLRLSKARKQFLRRWATATSTIQREQAALELLEADHGVAGGVHQLVRQRGYLIAVKEYCSQLPFLATLFPSSPRIEEIYVELPVSVVESDASGWKRSTRIASSAVIGTILRDLSNMDGSHYVCLGGPGSGKTTLCRSVVAHYCQQVLLDHAAVMNPNVLLPAYVRAPDLARTPQALRTALKAATESAAGLFLDLPLQQQFFEHELTSSSRSWLVVIDGVDEITDLDVRAKLIHALRRVHLEHTRKFRFLISCRDTAIPLEAFGHDFRVIRLEDPSQDDKLKLFKKYSQVLGRAVKTDTFSELPLRPLMRFLNTPLLIAISSTSVWDGTDGQFTQFRLFDDFVKYLLHKRDFSAADAESLIRVVSKVAAAETHVLIDIHLLRLAEKHGLITSRLPTQIGKSALTERLVASGLVTVSAGEVRFTHASIGLFFRASSFASEHTPGANVWQAVNPYLNGWDFAQFVLEKWMADGADISDVCRGLLSYGDEGLELFSTIAGATPSLPPKLVSAAVEKWQQLASESKLGAADAVSNLSFVARSHEAGLAALETIALDWWTYMDHSFEAAVALARHGRLDISRESLRKILALDSPMEQERAAECFYDIGLQEEAIQLLRAFVAQWSNEGLTDERLWGLCSAVEALHNMGESVFARATLDSLCNLHDMKMGDAKWIARAYNTVADKATAMDFVKRWVGQNPDHAQARDILPLPGQNLESWTRDALDTFSPERDSLGRHAALQRLIDRLSTIEGLTARLCEIVRNQYIERGTRLTALEQLATLDQAGYRRAALYVIERGTMVPYEKSKLVDVLKSSGYSRDVLAALDRYVTYIHCQDVRDAEFLIRAGVRDPGLSYLNAIASDPETSHTDHAEAIQALASCGAGDLALRFFRDSVQWKRYTAASFEVIAKALRATEHADDTKQMLWRVMRTRSQPFHIRLKASEILYSPDLTVQEKRTLTRFLKRVALDETLEIQYRFEAIDQWYELNSTAPWDLCFSIAEGLDTPFEAGMEAAKRVARWGDSFSAFDAYNDVVWDKKITLAQHLTGLRHIRTEIIHEVGYEEREKLKSFIDAVESHLQQIACDSSLEPHLRLTALDCPDEQSDHINGAQMHDDAWPTDVAIQKFLQDEGIPESLKQTALLRLHHCRPRLAARYHDFFNSGLRDIPSLLRSLKVLVEIAEPDLAATLLNEIARSSRIALSNRFKAIRLMSDAGAKDLAIQIAREMSVDLRGNTRIPPGAIDEWADVLRFLGLEPEALTAGNAPPAHGATAESLESLRRLAAEGRSVEAKTGLQTLLQRIPHLDSNEEQPESYLHAALMLSYLGEEKHAADAFIAIANQRALPLWIRLKGCTSSFRLGFREISRGIAREIARRSPKSVFDRICIAECCLEVGLEDLARHRTIEILEQDLSGYDADHVRRLCLKLKLAEKIPRASGEHPQDQAAASPSEIEELIKQQLWREVSVKIASSRDELLDKDPASFLETLKKLHETPLAEFARGELMTIATAESDDPYMSMIAAAALIPFGYADTAIETFRSLSQDERLAPHERLWLADTLLSVGYDELAYDQLLRVSGVRSLPHDDQQFFDELRERWSSH